jgi:hypothetical protein
MAGTTAKNLGPEGEIMIGDASHSPNDVIGSFIIVVTFGMQEWTRSDVDINPNAPTLLIHTT